MHRKKESFNVIFSCTPCVFFPKYDQQKNIYVQIKVESFFLRKSQSAIIFHLSESWPAQDTAAIVTWFIWKLHKSHKTVSEYFQMNKKHRLNSHSWWIGHNVHRVGILLFTIERMASLKMKKNFKFFSSEKTFFSPSNRSKAVDQLCVLVYHLISTAILSKLIKILNLNFFGNHLLSIWTNSNTFCPHGNNSKYFSTLW